MGASSISAEQRVKVMTLWNQYKRRSLDVLSDDREERLAWAGGVVQRKISSFNELTGLEAARVISALNVSLGLPEHQPRSRERAQAAGTHGRRNDDGRNVEIASQADLDRIQHALDRLGWDQNRFDRFLASPTSPIRGKAKIQTVGDANKVWWALKRFIKREGKWEN